MTGYSKAQVTKLLKIPKDKPKNETFLTFYDPGYSINRLRMMYPDLFWSKPGEGWYKDEKFANRTDEPCERQILMHALDGSTNKTMDEQKKMQPKGCRIPRCREFITAILLHYLATGQRLYTDLYYRFDEQTVDGNFVFVVWDGVQLDFGVWDGGDREDIGSCSVRDSRAGAANDHQGIGKRGKRHNDG